MLPIFVSQSGDCQQKASIRKQVAALLSCQSQILEPLGFVRFRSIHPEQPAQRGDFLIEQVILHPDRQISIIVGRVRCQQLLREQSPCFTSLSEATYFFSISAW